MVSSSQHKLLCGLLLGSPRRRFQDGLFCGLSADAGSRIHTAPRENNVCQEAMQFLCWSSLFLSECRIISRRSVSAISSTRQRNLCAFDCRDNSSTSNFWILAKIVPVFDPIPETCRSCSFPANGSSNALSHRLSQSLLSNSCRCRFTMGGLGS